ncbi:unnamed protein product [Mytilus coruscus]|uniref:Reverse transcriptase domain-containing protein n=1 Tax=Mytilus coruscus TaxID=42192 RepID=A0A6J8ED06_MYTCO|nr:unnamed protein product [Mytilus coruscus]
MNLLVKSAEKMSIGPVKSSGVRAFMDDMKITAKSVLEGKLMLQDLGELIDWARIKFKLSRSRGLILKKGKVQDRKIRIGGDIIPTIMEKPVKSLGKWFRDSLNDRQSVDEMVSQAGQWMDIIDKYGKYKAWCYQHGILPRITWPLLKNEGTSDQS